MKIDFNIKNFSLCKKHISNPMQRSNVCCHIGETLNKDSSALPITTVHIERILLDKYYEKYWICQNCAEGFGISATGELWYDPNLRNFLEDESFSADGLAETFVIDLPNELKGLIGQVSSECFSEKYSDQIFSVEASVSLLKEVAISASLG